MSATTGPRRNAPIPPTEASSITNANTTTSTTSSNNINNNINNNNNNNPFRSPSPTGILVEGVTGYASGVANVMLKENIDAALDTQGLSTNAVQVGLLRGKVQGLQQELQRLKGDMRETLDKLTHTASKLNEQKVQNSTLLHQQNALMAKLSHAEGNEKELEEALLSERRAHNNTRDSLERAKAMQAELEQNIAQLHNSSRTRQHNTSTAEELAMRLQDRSQYVPTKEYNEMMDKARRTHEALMEQVRTSFDRIAATQEEDETSLFIARSAVLSAATDLETKLCHTENVVESLQATMAQFSREYEDDTSRMLLSLMSENKELWGTITKLQYELDRAQAELTARGRRDDYVHKDQLDYMQKQVSVLEERLKKAHEAIEQQTQAVRDHAEQMREVMDENEELRNRAKECEEEVQQLRAQLALREREADDSVAQSKALQRQVQELTQVNMHQQNQIASLNDQIRNLQEQYDTETRAQMRQLSSERDDAVDAANRLRGDLEDAMSRLANAEKELDARTTYFNSYKSEMEQQHISNNKALQEELLNNRTVYENEIEELRRELSRRSDDLHIVTKELEIERLEKQNHHGTQKAMEDAHRQLQSELSSARSTSTKLEERLKRLQQELEAARAATNASDAKNATLLTEQTKLLQQVGQLQEQLAEEKERHDMQFASMERDWRESEKSRTVLVEEVTKLRVKATEDSAFRSLRERMERDKEQLMAENVRLHQNYQEVQQQNVSLQHSLTQLKNRLSSITQLQQQLEDVQRRLAELPALRQAAEEARRETARAKEEAEVLKQERNEMSQRLEYFLEESRVAVKKDTDLDRLFREASSQVKRLDQQIDEATHRNPALSASRQSTGRMPSSIPPNTSTNNNNTSGIGSVTGRMGSTTYSTPQRPVTPPRQWK